MIKDEYLFRRGKIDCIDEVIKIVKAIFKREIVIGIDIVDVIILGSK